MPVLLLCYPFRSKMIECFWELGTSIKVRGNEGQRQERTKRSLLCEVHFTMKAADGQPSSEAAKSRTRQPVEINVG